MSSHENPDPPRPVTCTAADLIACRYSWDEHRRGCKASYRRGVHQAIGLAYDLVEHAGGRREALKQLGRAERIAGELRFVRKDRGNGMLLDEIRQRMARRRVPAGSHRASM
jgi:hypothetical protein